MFKRGIGRPEDGEEAVIDWVATTLLLVSAGEALAEPSASEPVRFAQVVIREQIVVRVPGRLRLRPEQTPAHIAWVESKGPKCVPAAMIRGASLLGQNSVDLILKDRSRIRARLENSCPALDYYYGFYIKPNKDGMICADRDTIRSRMGGECEIDQFRSLRPKELKRAKRD